MKTIIRKHNHQILISAAALMTPLLILVLSSCSLYPKLATSDPDIEISVTSSPISLVNTQDSNAPENNLLSNTKQPSLPEATETPCLNQAMAGRPFDVTIPDGMEVLPGRSFTKTWRLMNSGTCSWTLDYSLVWFSGVELAQQMEIQLPTTVNPGEVVDVSVDMTAPMEAGEAQSNWKLKDDEGTFFGIGPNGDAPFWVNVKVLQEVSATPELTSTPTPTPLVFSAGAAVMIIEDGFDLDNGLQNPAIGIDISLLLQENGEMIVVPVNGTRLMLAGNDASYYFCKNSVLVDEIILISANLIGQSICYQTNLGLPGMLKLIQVQSTDQFIEISYITWVAP
jgi:hypothetical protein